MKQSWTTGLNEEQTKIIKQDFKGSIVTRSRLAELITNKIRSSNATVRSKESYDIANWAYLQADAIGYERALNEIISLILDKSVE